MKRSISLLTIAFFLHISFSMPAQTIWYVDADATGAETGTSWADAFTDLQSALAVAQSGDQVWVAEGVYRPDSVDRLVSFELKNGVQMYGGFGGWESSLGERDWEAHPTVLSGEIGDPSDSTDNSYTVVYMKDVDSTTVIDGFVIRDGHANYGYAPWTKYGGGMYLDGRDGGYVYAHVRHCVFEDNFGRVGGGLMIDGSNYGSVAPRIESCTFRYNRAQLGGGACRSGGSYIERQGDFVDCLFYDNYASQWAGGLYYYEGPGIDRFEIVGCVFEGNRAGSLGSTLMRYGGRINGTSSLLVDSCFSHLGEIDDETGYEWYVGWGFYGGLTVKLQNSILEGGGEANYFFLDGVTSIVDGIYTELFVYNTLFKNTVFSLLAGCHRIRFSDVVWDNDQMNDRLAHFSCRNLSIEKSLVLYNSSEYSYVDPYDTPTFLFPIYIKTFSDDDISQDTFRVSFVNFGIYEYEGASDTSGYLISVFPSNLIDDFSVDFVNGFFSPKRRLYGLVKQENSFPVSLYNVAVAEFGTAESTPYHLTHCYVGDTTGVGDLVEWGPGNLIGGAAGFVDTASGDFHLMPCSPLRDGGYTPIVNELGLSTDLDGLPRVQGSAVDIGPYEHGALRLVVDSIQGVAHCASQGVPVWVRAEHACPPVWVWPAGTQDTVWSDSSSVLELSLGGGVHEVVVQDSRGEVDTLWVEVPVEPLSVVVEAEAVQCPGTGGMVEVSSVPGAEGPLQYAWSTGDTTAQVTGLSAGVYAVTVTDGWGCTATDSVAVEVWGALPLALSTVPVSCYGASDGVLSVSGLGSVWPQTWQWSDGSTDSLRTGLSAGGYGVTVTDALGCTGSLTAVLTEPDSLVAWIEGDTVLCSGGEVELRAVGTGGTPGYVASWSTGQAGATLTVMGGGSYALTLTDAHGCEATAAATVAEASPPTVTWTVDSATSAQSADGRIELTVSGSWGPYEAQWSTGATGLVLDSVSAGTYAVTVTDDAGCSYGYQIEVPAGMVTGTQAVSGASLDLQIRPNPSGAEGAWLEVRGMTGGYAVSVYDDQGRRLWRSEGRGALVRLPGLPAGTYRVEVQQGEARGVESWVVVE